MSKNNTKILIVDDEESIRKLLSGRFSREGWQVETAEDGRIGVEKAKMIEPTVVITDIKMPGMDGFQFIEASRKKGLECPIIVITGHGEKECAIESIHKGAFDYLEKPFDMDSITQVVKRAVDHEEMRKAKLQLTKDLEVANKKLENQLEVKSILLERVEKEAHGDDILIGKSEPIQNLKEMVKTIAESFSGDHEPVVLVTGESGTGKEVMARYIHANIFKDGYKNKPFVALNCAAFPDTLLESELFGYEKGAFTGAVNRKPGLFEVASGGTLFLDEIGEMDLKMQAKLLRVLQERVIRRVGGTTDIPVRPHIIAATNRDLARAVQDKTFREDLFYRLNTIPIQIPPLRSRLDDIDLLANSFLKKLSSGKGKRFSGFSTSALKALGTYNWPGNVRELKSVIERAVILEKGPILELSQLRKENLQSIRAEVLSDAGTGQNILKFQNEPTPASVTGTNQVSSPTLAAINGIDIMKEIDAKGLTQLRKEMDENFVKQVLVELLTNHQGNVSSVARKLKLDRANLLRMLKRFGIQPETFRVKAA